MKALILVGGYGTRLRPLTLSVPKPLIEFCNKPIVEYQIKGLMQAGVAEFILAVAYQPSVMMEALSQMERAYNVRIVCSREEVPLGTAGPIRLAKRLLLSSPCCSSCSSEENSSSEHGGSSGHSSATTTCCNSRTCSSSSRTSDRSGSSSTSLFSDGKDWWCVGSDGNSSRRGGGGGPAGNYSSSSSGRDFVWSASSDRDFVLRTASSGAAAAAGQEQTVWSNDFPSCGTGLETATAAGPSAGAVKDEKEATTAGATEGGSAASAEGEVAREEDGRAATAAGAVSNAGATTEGDSAASGNTATAGEAETADSTEKKTWRGEDVHDCFFVCNSDVICSFPLHAMLQFHKTSGAEATILVTEVENPSAYGVVQHDPNGRVRAFVEKPQHFVGNAINAGVYILNNSVIDRIPLRPSSLEKDIFPQLAKEQTLYCFHLDGYWADIGQPQDFLKGMQLHMEALRCRQEQQQQHRHRQQASEGTEAVEEQREPLLISDASETVALPFARKAQFVGNVLVCRVEGLTVVGEDVQVADECCINGTFILPHKFISQSIHEPGTIIL